MALDVCSPDATSILDKAISVHGRIDILVNNAGYALLGAFETFRSVTRHLLPTEFLLIRLVQRSEVLIANIVIKSAAPNSKQISSVP
jgi:NAD(P)-dependent dehydrogenase (short-subunit alcohol dehydrogenase family)